MTLINGFTVKKAAELTESSYDWVAKFCRSRAKSMDIRKFGQEWIVTVPVLEAIVNAKGKRGRPKKNAPIPLKDKTNLEKLYQRLLI